MRIITCTLFFLQQSFFKFTFPFYIDKHQDASIHQYESTISIAQNRMLDEIDDITFPDPRNLLPISEASSCSNDYEEVDIRLHEEDSKTGCTVPNVGDEDTHDDLCLTSVDRDAVMGAYMALKDTDENTEAYLVPNVKDKNTEDYIYMSPIGNDGERDVDGYAVPNQRDWDEEGNVVPNVTIQVTRTTPIANVDESDYLIPNVRFYNDQSMGPSPRDSRCTESNDDDDDDEEENYITPL